MNSARTAGPIVTGKAPFDSSIRRNDDGADLGSISSTWHVARAAPSRPPKKIRTHLQVKRGAPPTPELATPNSALWCTLAMPTWRRMKKGARVHSARAVHVQVF